MLEVTATSSVSYVTVTSAKNSGNGKAAITLIKLAVGIEDFSLSEDNWTNEDIEVTLTTTENVVKSKIGSEEYQESKVFTITERED